MSASIEQRRPRCFPMTLIIDCCKPHTESVPEFLTNLSLSDLYNLPGESVPMNVEIFSAMRGGNREFLQKIRSYGTPMACLKNDKGDSILHLAAGFGHLKLVESIISDFPSLLLEPNWKDQIPIHVAAHAGHLAVVKTLIASITYFSARLVYEDNVYLLKDTDGETPLHAALKGHHMETALCLVNANKLGSFLENNDELSPLYMAVESGGLALVKEMLNGLGNNVQGRGSNIASQLEGRKSLVHAALKAKNTDILDIILNKDPSLIDQRDEEGQTCLSFGVSVGYYKGVCNLLDRSTSSVFECNDDGSFPIHVAVEKGHVDVVKEILKRCPDSIELLSKQGQNILHVAAKSGKSRSLLLKHIKGLDRKKNHLIEEQDEDGNTPLHLATINWRPRIVRDLTWFSSNATKVLDIKNKDGLRALDISELNLQSNYIFRERMTMMVLLSAYKPIGYEKILTNGMTLRSRSEPVGVNKFKDSINALLVVATLVATVTFAAGITVPGGFNSAGMAILANNFNLESTAENLNTDFGVRNINFLNFVVADTVAMLSSLLAILTLILAQMGDPELVHQVFRLAMPSLAFALTFMSIAFINGVLASTSPNYIVGLVIGYTVFAYSFVILLFLVPYVGLHSRLVGIDFQLRILLWFVNEDDAETYHTSGSAQTRV